MVNTLKIKGRLAELNLKQKDLAKASGMSQCTVSQKIRGDRPLTLDEAEMWATILKIDDQHFGEYFFARKIA